MSMWGKRKQVGLNILEQPHKPPISKIRANFGTRKNVIFYSCKKYVGPTKFSQIDSLKLINAFSQFSLTLYCIIYYYFNKNLDILYFNILCIERFNFFKAKPASPAYRLTCYFAVAKQAILNFVFHEIGLFTNKWTLLETAGRKQLFFFHIHFYCYVSQYCIDIICIFYKTTTFIVARFIWHMATSLLLLSCYRPLILNTLQKTGLQLYCISA